MPSLALILGLLTQLLSFGVAVLALVKSLRAAKSWREERRKRKGRAKRWRN